MPNLSNTISGFNPTAAFNDFQYVNANAALIQSEIVKLLKANLGPLIDVMNTQMGLSIVKPTKFEAAPAQLEEKFIDSVLVGFSNLAYESFAPRNFKNNLTVSVYIIGKPIRSKIQVPEMWQRAEAVTGVMYQYLNGYCTEEGTRLWGKLIPSDIMALPEEFADYSGSTVMFQLEIAPGNRAWKPS